MNTPTHPDLPLDQDHRDKPIRVKIQVELTLEMRQSTWLGDLMVHAEYLIKSEHSSLKVVPGTMQVMGLEKI